MDDRICLSPRSEYAAITDGKLYYTLNDATKFLMLPQYVVGSDQATLIGAIQQWAGKKAGCSRLQVPSRDKTLCN